MNVWLIVTVTVSLVALIGVATENAFVFFAPFAAVLAYGMYSEINQAIKPDCQSYDADQNKRPT